MALTERKKRGLVLIVAGGLSIAAGAVLMLTTSTPAWVPTALSIAGLVAGALGVTVAVPDVKD